MSSSKTAARADGRLSSFRHKIQQLMWNGPGLPFICDGNPFDCSAFLVNLTSCYKYPLLEFWDDDLGFDRSFFLDALSTERLATLPHRDRLKLNSPGKPRELIDGIVESASPVKVLETSLCQWGTQTAKSVRHEEMRLFEFLVGAIRPDVIAVYGREAQEQLERRFGYRLSDQFRDLEINGHTVRVAAIVHRPPLTLPRAAQWGTKIRTEAAPASLQTPPGSTGRRIAFQ